MGQNSDELGEHQHHEHNTSPRNGNGITWKVVAVSLATFSIMLGGWAVSRITDDIAAVKREFRIEIEQGKRDRLADLSRLTAAEAKSDGLRDIVTRTEQKVERLEAKIDTLLSQQQGRRR